MNRVNLQRLSRVRLEEARSLFHSGLYSGAYYLRIRGRMCFEGFDCKENAPVRVLDLARVKNSYTHSLVELFKVADLVKDFQVAIQGNAGLQTSWDIVKDWSEQSRYEVWSQAEADAMIDAVGKPNNGVLPWIKQRW